MSNNGLRRSGYNWQHADHQGTPQDDPLSELARLIEEDPFADFDQGRRAPASPAPSRAQEPQNWSWEDEAPAAGHAAGDDPNLYEEYGDQDWQASPEEIASGSYEQQGVQDYEYDAYSDHRPEDWTHGDGYPAESGAEAYGYAQPGLRAHDDYQYDYEEGTPRYDESGHLPPLVAEERRGRRKTAVFGGLALLALIGTAGAYGYRELAPTAGDGPPIMVAANPQPVKVKPEEPGGNVVPNQERLVFNRGNEAGQAAKTEERIVSREEPVEEVPLRESAADADEGAAAAGGEPKRVRTVVVRPDGTIVTQEPPAAAPQEQVAALREGDGPVTLYDSGTSPASTTGSTPAPATDQADTAGSGQAVLPPPRPAGSAASGNGEAFVPPSATQERAAPASASNQGAGRPLQLVPQPAAAQGSNQQPTQVAAAPARQDPAALVQSGSGQSAGQASAPATTSAGLGSGGYVVQVASTRSEADAESVAGRIQSQHGSALSGYQTAVQRADLGDRGVYYRVAVGPLGDSQSAAALCSKLKSAGLDCFVRRN